MQLNAYFEIRAVVLVIKWVPHIARRPPTTSVATCQSKSTKTQRRRFENDTQPIVHRAGAHIVKGQLKKISPPNPVQHIWGYTVAGGDRMMNSGGEMAVDSEKSFSEEKVWSLCKMPFWQSNNSASSSSSSTTSAFQSVHQQSQSHQLLQSSNAVSSMAKSLLPTRRRFRLDPPNKLYFPCKVLWLFLFLLLSIPSSLCLEFFQSGFVDST